MEAKRHHVLVCDNDPVIRDSLELILEKDYTLGFATNGQEAVEYLKHRPADLLILDIHMPDGNGLEVLKRIKRTSRRTKILMLTGYESIDVAVLAVEKGANDYLTKPFERDKLISRVQFLLSDLGA